MRKPQLFELADILLDDIKHKGVNFAHAINNLANRFNLSKEERSLVASLVVSALRNYLAFANFIDTYLPNLDEKARDLLILYLANKLVVEVVDDNKSRAYVILKTNNEFKEFFSLEFDYKAMINIDTDDEAKKLSIRYNVPYWVCRIFNKVYPLSLCKNILNALRNKAPMYALINHEDDLNDLISGYQAYCINEDVLKYQGKVNYFNHSSYLEKKTNPITKAEKYIYDQLDIDLIRGLFVYQESENYFIDYLVNKYSNLISLDVVGGNSNSYINVKNKINHYDCPRIDLYETTHETLLSSISEKKHLVLVYPDNSHFSKLRSDVDYFLKLDSTKLDGLVLNQERAINNCAEFVDDGGYLVYVVDTIDKKETHFIVEKFLKKNRNFHLVEEQQFLPCDKYDSVLYFALLAKEKKND